MILEQILFFVTPDSSIQDLLISYELFAAISLDPDRDTIAPGVKVRQHPPSASRVQLPDGRYMAYREQGVSAETARFSLVAPHSFGSSRLAGRI